MKITSLKQLKEWNSKYKYGSAYVYEPDVSKHPILLEWFMDWFFEEALLDMKVAKEAFEEFVIFTIICESMTKEAALDRCLHNLNYWYIRAAYYNSRFKQFRKFKDKCL